MDWVQGIPYKSINSFISFNTTILAKSRNEAFSNSKKHIQIQKSNLYITMHTGAHSLMDRLSVEERSLTEPVQERESTIYFCTS